MSDSRFPTRQYPYRSTGLAGGSAASPALQRDALHRFVLGIDRHPRPMTDPEKSALGDPFAVLLQHTPFPLTLEALLARLDADMVLPAQEVYVVGDGAHIVSAPSTLERNLRLAFTRSRRQGGNADLMISTSTRISDPTTFLQVIGWDELEGVFNYYERRGGTWIWAGNSWHALEDPTRGRGPFDSHVNGSVVMKELKVPWSHWHSQSTSISDDVLDSADPLRALDLWKKRTSAERFETEVARAGVSRWTSARMKREVSTDNRVGALPRMMRQILTTTTVNLVSSDVESELAERTTAMRLPAEFFLDRDALVGVLELDLGDTTVEVGGKDYAAARKKLGLRLDDGSFRREGETLFAFLVPERAHEDLAVLEALIEREVLSKRLATCLLLVDFCNPVFSERRAALLKYVPDETVAGSGGAALDATLIGNIETATEDAAAELLDLWARSERADWDAWVQTRITRYLEAIRSRLASAAGAEDVLKLAQGRRALFRGMSLAEFALTVPKTDNDRKYAALRMNEDGQVR